MKIYSGKESILYNKKMKDVKKGLFINKIQVEQIYFIFVYCEFKQLII